MSAASEPMASSPGRHCSSYEAAAFQRLLVRPKQAQGECELGYWHRVAHENGLRNSRWLGTTLGIRSLAQLRVCPACLGTDTGHWAQSWRTSHLPVCSLHQVWLVDECSACGSQINFRSSSFLRCQCGQALSAANAPALDREVLRAINEAGASSEVLLWLGSISCFGLSTRPQRRAATRQVRLLRNLFVAGAIVVNDWSTSFPVLLDRARHQPQSPGEPQLLREAFPGLSRMIRDIACDHWRSQILEALTGYVAQSLMTDCPINRSTRVSNQFQPCFNSLAQDLGIGKRRLSRLVDELPPDQLLVRRAGKGRRRLVVRADHRRLFEDHLGDSISLKEAARMLGLQPKRVELLCEAGGLRRNGGPFSKRAALGFARSLMARARLPPIGSAACTLSDAFKKWIRSADTLRFFASIETGDLVVWSNTHSSRLGEMILDERQVRAWSASIRQEALDWISIPKAAVALQLKQEVVYDLVHRGWIETVVRDMRGRRARAISQDALRHFQKQYEPLIAAAKREGVLPRHALSWALETGLEFISGPSVDGARQYFVRRLRSRETTV